MGQRPLSITIIGWGIVIYSFAWLIYEARALIYLGSPEFMAPILKRSLEDQEKASVLIAVVATPAVLGCVTHILVGTFVLAGAKWARNLFILLLLLNLGLYFSGILSRQVWIPTLQALAAVILFLPGANRYFSAPRP